MIHDHCVACGTADNLNQHHLIPRSLGGSDDESNLLTLCGPCHAKVHQVRADWRHSELTKTAMQAKKQRGEYIGGHTPYGFNRSDCKLVRNEVEQNIITQAKHLRANGLSLTKIALKLDRQGIKTRTGSLFDATQIKRMVAFN